MFLIALGANLPSAVGAPVQTLIHALSTLAQTGLRLTAVSRFYRSAAFPAGSGPDYVNACACLQAALSPEEMLALLARTETTLGRVRHGRWGARGIDLDLIGAGMAIRPDAATQTAWRALPLEAQMREAPTELILPHPRVQDRAFVLIPLAEIAPNWRHPLIGLSVHEMLDALPESEKATLSPISAP